MLLKGLPAKQQGRDAYLAIKRTHNIRLMKDPDHLDNLFVTWRTLSFLYHIEDSLRLLLEPLYTS
uniref:Uncharacterized protein n=1 Tax=Picea glauca TaxID=3330 RepID=A0A117NIH1_PICGL|nr:hypothetical protein ABT39_MTgene3171 [Picea glauca]QHR89061.1 hypothetical protein Q903MT_gene3080 [Picea sitchensis]